MKTRILLLGFFVCALIVFPFIRDRVRADISSGLIAYWAFDEGSGTSAEDSAGGHDGTLSGGPTWVTGFVGSGALDFNGGGKTVTTGWNPGGYPLSVCAWIRPTVTGTINNIINALHFDFQVVGFGSNDLGVYNNNQSAGAAGVITVGEWQHVCATVSSGNDARVYVDGVDRGGGNLGAPPVTGSITIGSSFPGPIDDLRVYSRVLSPSDVNELYLTSQGLTPDTTPPVISDVASSTTSVSATIAWTTDEPSTSQVEYGLTSSYGSSSSLDTSTTTSHSVNLTGLAPGTVYHFKVLSLDDSSNVGSSTDYTLLTAPTDSTAPNISSISSGTPSFSSTTISWTTDELASSRVYYGTTTSYGFSTTSSSMKTSHSMPLRGLTAGTTWHYIVVSSDDVGNTATSSDQTLDTLDLRGSDIISADHLVEWSPGINVGVPGGIRTRNTLVDITQAPYNADNTGASDVSSILNQAIIDADPGDVIYLPDGTYRIDSTVSTYSTAKDNITIRGAGMGGTGTTTIDCRTGNTCFNIGTNTDYQWNTPSSNNTILTGNYKGSERVTIGDTSAFSPGQIIRFRPTTNDSSLPVISVFGYPGLRQQFSRVTDVDDTSISFYPGLYDDWSDFTVAINRAADSSEFVGIEDLVIDGANGSSFQFGIYAEQTYGSWVKGVRVVNSLNYNISFGNSLNCELRENYSDQLNHGGTNGAGFLFGTVSGCLVEDNVIVEAFPGIEVNFSSMGNVFGYNFVNKADGTIGINTNHGAHNSFNLYEGNISHNIMSDGYFGSNSHDTLFRNWFTAAALASTTPHTPSLTYCVSLKRFTREFSLVGNLLGSDEVSMTSECDLYGQPNIGNFDSIGTAQASLGDYWTGWNPTDGSIIAGTLTTRATDSTGTITLSSGSLLTNQAQVGLRWSGHTTPFRVDVGTVTGNSAPVTSNYGDGDLPAQGTELSIWGGTGGFQELDLDVEETTFKKGNYSYYSDEIPVDQALGGDTLPDSLYRTSKPSFFGSSDWPPFDPESPATDYEAVPAGYRFMNNNASVPVDADPPSVTTSAASSITSTTATMNGSITDTGGANASARGFAYGSSSNLSTGVSTTTSSGSFSAGSFTGALSSLTCGTTYYFRAYATNTEGTSYGSILSFSTSACSVPSITTSAASSITQTGATLNGSITSTGGTNATQSGFAYGTASTLSTVIATTTLGAQTGTASFSSSVSSLTCATTYYARAYATNTTGTGYGSIVSFTTSACAPTVTTQAASSVTNVSVTFNGNITDTGGENASARGFSYGLTTAYGATTTSSGSFSTGAFTGSASSLSCDTVYHFRSYAANSGGVSYGSDTTFTTDACVEPTVSTGSASSVTRTAATLGGSITDTGGNDASQSGFAYGDAADLSSVIATTTLGAQTGTASFSSTVSAMTCGTTYYFRAYATNDAGTSYGSIVPFDTLSCSSSGGGGGGGVGLTGRSRTPVIIPAPYDLASFVELLITLGAIPPEKALEARALVASSMAAGSSVFNRDLKVYDIGPDVLELQKYLNSKGFKIAESGPGSPGQETEKFGAATYVALRRFQAFSRLPVTGYFGPLTRAHIQQRN